MLRAILAFVVTVLIYAAGWVATKFGWQFFVDAINHFNRNWLLWLLILSGMIALARKWMLKRKAGYFSLLYAGVITYALVFQTGWIFKSGTHPTFLFIWSYLTVLTIIGLLAIDHLRKAFRSLVAKIKPEYQTMGWFLLWIVFNGLIVFLVQDRFVDRAARFFSRPYYFWLFLLPLCSGLVRQLKDKKPVRYVQGLVIYVVFMGLYTWLAAKFRFDAIVTFLHFYVAFWVHHYYEELLSRLARRDGEIRRVEKKEKKLPSNKVLAALSRFFGGLGRGLGKFGTGTLAVAKRNRIALIIAVVVLGLVGAAIPVVKHLYKNRYVTVSEFTPSGEVSDRIAVKIVFSDPVKPREGSVEELNCFEIEPAVSGTYRQDNPTTITFLPAEPLKPATDYTVQFHPEKLKADLKKLTAQARTTFHTRYFRVNNTNLFYNVDQITGEEMQIMGQVDFNYPVKLADLRAHAKIEIEGQTWSAEFEKSIIPQRFYFKGAPVKPGDKDQKVKLVVDSELTCINGTLPLGEAYERTMTLPARPKLEVREIRLWHEPGTTFISVMFNLPVSAKQVRRFVKVAPGIDWKVETEYALAVLRADFKPNTNYEIKVLPGLVAKTGQVLEKEYKRTVRIRDLPSSVTFARPGNILSLNGPKTIAVKTVNLDEAHVTIRKVFKNNLISFLEYKDTDQKTKLIYDGQFKVKEGQINEEVQQYINLSEFQAEPYKGLFQIQLRDPRQYYSSARAWILCTDIGLMAKRSGDDLLVYAISYETLEPLANIKIELISYTNQVMDAQQTDASGKAVFRRYQKNEYDLKPFYVLASKGEDFSFLHFEWSRINQYQFSVGGDRHDREGIEAFITPERGVYRPGETAYFTAIVRNTDMSLPPSLPVKLVVRNPRGAVHKELNGRCNANGVDTFSVPFGLEALTGRYSVVLKQVGTERALGSTSIKVEEFIPDKLKVSVKAPKTAVKASDPLEFKVQARQLFGAPAANSKVQTFVRFYSRIFSHEDFKGYTFADYSRTFQDEEMDLGQGKLDAKGLIDYSVKIPAVKPASALKAYIYTEVFDSGGREVSASGYADINVYTHYLGLKVTSEPPQMKGKKFTVSAVAIDPEGKKIKLDNVRVVVKRKSWYSVFRNGRWGSSSYRSAFYEELLKNELITLNGEKKFSFTPEQEGEYRILLISPDGMQSSLTVNVLGHGYETTSLEAPDKLMLTLNQSEYAVGEQVRLHIKAPFPGKLYLSMEREQVFFTKIIDMPDTEAQVTIPVISQYIPNAYVVAMIVRKPDEKLGTLPMVSYGIEPVMIKKSERQIKLNWDTVKSVKSTDGIDVAVHAGSLPENTDVVLAAVDEGILQITNFTTPNPLEYFYRKRSLSTMSFTTFNLLLPDLWREKFAIGGGEGGDISRRHLNPVVAKKKKSFARFSGLLKPDADGWIRYHFKTDDFNGEARVMAVAVSGDYFGSSHCRVKVADPIVVQLNTPRFVAPSDEFQIPVEIFNMTGSKGVFEVALNASGPVRITGKNKIGKITLEPEAQKRVKFFLSAQHNAGVAKFDVTASGNKEATTKQTEISVRPIHTLKSVVKQGRLKPAGEKEVVIPAGFIPYGQKIRANFSSNPLFQYMGALEYLIQYPYGCLEQTTSRIFPLIYFRELGLATGRFTGKGQSIDRFVQTGIHRLETLQLPSGEFCMWPGGRRVDRWLTFYVSHFLLEAKRQGYQVDATVLHRTRNFILRATHKPKRRQGRLDRRDAEPDTGQIVINPYLLYLRVLIDSPDREGMAYMLNHKLDTLQETDRAVLSMCYSGIGDKATAEKIIQPDFKSKFIAREQYGSFNSSIRNTAMYLAALAQANPDSTKIKPLVKYLVSKMERGHFGTTQENAWAFMALGRVYGKDSRPVNAELLINDEIYRKLNGQDPVIEDNTLSGKTVTIKNMGTEDLYYYILAEGTPLDSEKPGPSKGLKVKRYYRNQDGGSLNITNVAQGQMAVITLELAAVKDPVKNVILVDLLPAGFEIENPRLQTRGQLGFDPPRGLNIAYQDIRDDRILIFCDTVSGTQSFSYAVRAVTPGSFRVPDVLGEAMYDPEIKAVYQEKNKLNIVDNN